MYLFFDVVDWLFPFLPRLSQIISWTWGWAARREVVIFSTAPVVFSPAEAGRPSPTWASLRSTPLRRAASEARVGVPITTSSVWWAPESWACRRRPATSPPRRLRRAAAWAASRQTWSKYTHHLFQPTRPAARSIQSKWRSTTARPPPRLCPIRAPTTIPPPNRAWTAVSFPWSQTTTSSTTRET